jgi:hypothetical protein
LPHTAATMTSTPPPKRFKSDPLETPRSVIDDTMRVEQGLHGVFSQLDMPVPDGAMAAEMPATEDETVNNGSVASRVETYKWAFKVLERWYQLDETTCVDAIHNHASKLLPAIFNTNQDSLHHEYEEIIIQNPWLVHKLFDAFRSGEYHKIQRLGMCGSRIVRPPRPI